MGFLRHGFLFFLSWEKVERQETCLVFPSLLFGFIENFIRGEGSKVGEEKEE